MTEQQFVYLLQIMLQVEKKLQYCTFYQINEIWEHLDKRCPKCVAIQIVELYTGR